jgi:peptidoglycan/LPS O-acetylase OafA/YrhL
MNRAFSTYLDAVRFVAALTVLLSHWAYERFTGGAFLGIRDYNLGSDAVVVFFVLSGLVIAYTASTKDRTAPAFAFSRATRIVSVALPALIVTFALDRLGASLEPVAYDGWWYQQRSLLDMLLNGLSFSSEWHMPGIRLGSNGPYWSLSYEVAYYLLFGAAFFLTGLRRTLVLAALAVMIGPKVLLLLPVWLLGVALWQHIGKAKTVAGSDRLAPFWIALPPVVYIACLAAGIPQLLWHSTVRIVGVEPGLLRVLLGFSDEFCWNFVIGLLFAAHLAAVWRWTSARRSADRPGKASVAIRWLAGASFSIYLVHYPVMQFLDAVLPDALALRAFVLLGLTLGVCFLFAAVFERPLPQLRSALRRGHASFARVATTPVATAPARPGE